MLGTESAEAFLVGSDGWTVLNPSGDSLVFYVSSSEGNDANSGDSPAAPLKSIIEGMKRLRDGYPDQLLLKRGDVWSHAFAFWGKSGRSLDEPMVVGSYGDSTVRPRVVSNNEPGIRTLNDRVDYVAITGVHFQVAGRPAASGPTGIFWLSPSRGILLEDCLVEGFGRNIVVQGYFGLIEDFSIRRCVVIDSYDTGTLSQGLYCENVDGIWIEDSLFDYNGWHEGLYAQSTLNHNVYIHAECKNLVARGNIIGRASSHGVQARPGGLIEGNVFVRCPIALSFGYVLGNSPPTVGGIGGAVRGNAFLESNDIGDLPRGVGVEVANVSPSRGAVISGNYFIRNATSMPYGAAIELQAGNGLGINQTLVQGNVCYGYNAGVTAEGASSRYANLQVRDNYFVPLDTYSFAAHHRYSFVPTQMQYSGNLYGSPKNPSTWFRANGVQYNLAGWKSLTADSLAAAVSGAFPDASRTLTTYSESLGFAASPGAFLDQARTQSRLTWREELTAARIVDYLAVGFGGINPYQSCMLDALVEHASAAAVVDDGPAAITAGGPGCTVALSPAGGMYEYGQTVTCTAIPEPGHRFLYWHGDLLGETANPVELVAFGNMTIKAVFADENEPLYSLDLTVDGLGEVKVLPPGDSYPYGTVVTLVAEPDRGPFGGAFVEYEGDAAGTEPLTAITITGDAKVTAVFGKSQDLDAMSSTSLAAAIALIVLGATRAIRSRDRRYTRM